MKIFLSGSSTLHELPAGLRAYLDEAVKRSAKFLVGDCYGADQAFQNFLLESGCRNVTVHTSLTESFRGYPPTVLTGRARNNVGNWPVEPTFVEPGVHGRAFHTRKDMTMAAQANLGVIYWDLKSLGSKNNMHQLAERGRPFRVWRQDGINTLIISPDQLFDYLVRKPKLQL